MAKATIAEVLDKKKDHIIDETFGLDTEGTTVSDTYKKYYMDDIETTINQLKVSFLYDNQDLFNHYMDWFGELSQNLNISKKGMLNHLDHLNESILNDLSDETDEQAVSKRIDQGKEQFINGLNRKIVDPSDNTFLDSLVDMRTQDATEFIMEKAKNDTSVMTLFEEHLIPTLMDVGLLWQHHKISVAKEHYATAVIQNIIGMLYPYLFTENKKATHSLLAVCAGKELHEIGMRIIADVFEMEGFDTSFLGSNIPVEVILGEMKENPPSLLGISSTTAASLEDTKKLIDDVRNDDSFDQIKIMVGGYQFLHAKNLWKEVGADFTASSAKDALKKAKKMLGGHDDDA